MRLGVLKELKPKMVATFSDKAGAHEGHPFLVEAAVSLGGSQVREGINVYRFANRIPLLFEAGADVVTQVYHVIFSLLLLLDVIMERCGDVCSQIF